VVSADTKLRVVVVGSGLAGLSCALGLAREDIAVVVVTPGHAGRDGCTHRVHGLAPAIQLTAPWVRGDSPAHFLADLGRGGQGQERTGLAQVLAEHARPAAEELCELLGLEPTQEGPAQLPGHNYPRGLRCHPRRHSPLLQPLLAACKVAGVTIMERSPAIGLLLGGGRAAGIVLPGGTVGAARELAADAVVLACGGPSSVFASSTGPAWCVGSAIGWARRAGVLLHRPESIQFLPVLAAPPHCFPGTAALLGGSVAVDGVRLPADHDLEHVEMAIARGQRAEILVTPSSLAVEPHRWSRFFSKQLLLTVAAHHGIGGVAIDTWGRTSMPGLYACGEAAGGVQGRHRAMGTGLLEARIFGVRVARAILGDRHRLGRVGRADATVLAHVPRQAPGLAARLDALLAPLPGRPPAEVLQDALTELGRWQTANDGEPAGLFEYRTGLRWDAAAVVLECAAVEKRFDSTSARLCAPTRGR
jgi:L-aspartate oxidase